MGQSKIEVFRRILGDADRAQRANQVFEASYAVAVRDRLVKPLPGAAETITALRAAGIRVCLVTGFSPATRDAVLDALAWRPLIDLALLRLGGGAVSELAVAGDTPSDIEAGLRAGAGVVAGVLTGRGSQVELEKAGAPHVLESVTGLLPLLGLGPAQQFAE
jgi:phosphoglycolate phosphatase-like HAD superfamily hydrolase